MTPRPAPPQIVRRGKECSCFIEFYDIASAMGVHQSQQARSLALFHAILAG